ncbi:hypothetical protein EJ08DRAFT_701719 [Tothia fuscella]|uniref:Uncharacterized protein n=1 Tax=Tothia fuscella TaxID=1048955 RepID=A0A9P4NI28_9PEZI|nr:hypothetical protein EJ08DRAFT_701719 [Tothia fuscella]
MNRLLDYILRSGAQRLSDLTEDDVKILKKAAVEGDREAFQMLMNMAENGDTEAENFVRKCCFQSETPMDEHQQNGEITSNTTQAKQTGTEHAGPPQETSGSPTTDIATPTAAAVGHGHNSHPFYLGHVQRLSDLTTRQRNSIIHRARSNHYWDIGHLIELGNIGDDESTRLLSAIPVESRQEARRLDYSRHPSRDIPWQQAVRYRAGYVPAIIEPETIGFDANFEWPEVEREEEADRPGSPPVEPCSVSVKQHEKFRPGASPVMTPDQVDCNEKASRESNKHVAEVADEDDADADATPDLASFFSVQGENGRILSPPKNGNDLSATVVDDPPSQTRTQTSSLSDDDGHLPDLVPGESPQENNEQASLPPSKNKNLPDLTTNEASTDIRQPRTAIDTRQALIKEVRRTVVDTASPAAVNMNDSIMAEPRSLLSTHHLLRGFLSDTEWVSKNVWAIRLLQNFARWGCEDAAAVLIFVDEDAQAKAARGDDSKDKSTMQKTIQASLDKEQAEQAEQRRQCILRYGAKRMNDLSDTLRHALVVDAWQRDSYAIQILLDFIGNGCVDAKKLLEEVMDDPISRTESEESVLKQTSSPGSKELGGSAPGQRRQKRPSDRGRQSGPARDTSDPYEVVRTGSLYDILERSSSPEPLKEQAEPENEDIEMNPIEQDQNSQIEDIGGSELAIADEDKDFHVLMAFSTSSFSKEAQFAIANLREVSEAPEHRPNLFADYRPAPNAARGTFGVPQHQDRPSAFTGWAGIEENTYLKRMERLKRDYEGHTHTQQFAAKAQEHHR